LTFAFGGAGAPPADTPGGFSVGGFPLRSGGADDVSVEEEQPISMIEINAKIANKANCPFFNLEPSLWPHALDNPETARRLSDLHRSASIVEGLGVSVSIDRGVDTVDDTKGHTAAERWGASAVW